MSAEYYKRLERGNVSGVSELVLEGLARALHLDEAERAHLFDLVRATSPSRRGARVRSRRASGRSSSRSSTRIDAPATVRNARLDYVGANALGRALYAPLWEQPRTARQQRPLHVSRSDRRGLLSRLAHVASELVATSAVRSGATPTTASSRTSSASCRRAATSSGVRWAAHNVRFHHTGAKRIHHPVAGALDLTYETMELSADDGLTVAIFTAERGSASQEALDLLASWTATPEPTRTG